MSSEFYEDIAEHLNTTVTWSQAQTTGGDVDTDEQGDPIYSDSEIDARLQEGMKRVVTPDGTEKMSTAIVYTQSPVKYMDKINDRLVLNYSANVNDENEEINRKVYLT